MDSQNDQKEYFIELKLDSNGDIISAGKAPGSSLPEGVSAAWEDGALVIKGLPQYADGVQLDYGVRVVENTIDPYTAGDDRLYGLFQFFHSVLRSETDQPELYEGLGG